MAVVNEGNNVVTADGIIMWDGLTTPDLDERTGAPVHNLTVAIRESDKAEIEQLAQSVLNTSEFKGVLPSNGKWPIKAIDVSRFGESAALLNGCIAVTARTRNGAPQVFDANGQELNAMQYGKMLYPGAVVKLLIHAYAYNATGNKGVSAGLDGVQIIDATAPKLDVGGGMAASQVAACFGAPAATTTPPPTHVAANGAVITPPPTVQPNMGFVENAGVVTPPPPAHTMTAAAQGMTYEAAINAGWTDELLIAKGMMLP